MFGGALVTSVCHSVPLIVDLTSPILHQVEDVFHDEDFDIMAVYFEVCECSAQAKEFLFIASLCLLTSKIKAKFQSFSYNIILIALIIYAIVHRKVFCTIKESVQSIWFMYRH